MNDLSETQGRRDLYGAVHKGLRRAHARMVQALGSADFAEDCGTLLDDLRQHLAMAALHLQDEDDHIHAALEARAPGSTAQLGQQHDGHRAHFAEIERLAGEVAAGGPGALRAGRLLYLAFTRFVADDLAHMAEEELVAGPLLCRHFSEEELLAIHGAIVGGLPPAMAAAFLGEMVPAVNRAERVEMLEAIKRNAPPEAYAGLFAAVAPNLPEAEREYLEAMGLAA